MLGRGLGYADVQDVTSSNDQASKVSRGISSSKFPGTVEDNVHVAVAIDHLSAILGVILQADRNVSLQLPHQKVQWFS